MFGVCRIGAIGGKEIPCVESFGGQDFEFIIWATRNELLKLFVFSQLVEARVIEDLASISPSFTNRIAKSHEGFFVVAR